MVVGVLVDVVAVGILVDCWWNISQLLRVIELGSVVVGTCLGRVWRDIIHNSTNISVRNLLLIARSALGALAHVTDSRGKVHIPPEK